MRHSVDGHSSFQQDAVSEVARRQFSIVLEHCERLHSIMALVDESECAFLFFLVKKQGICMTSVLCGFCTIGLPVGNITRAYSWKATKTCNTFRCWCIPDNLHRPTHWQGKSTVVLTGFVHVDRFKIVSPYSYWLRVCSELQQAFCHKANKAAGFLHSKLHCSVQAERPVIISTLSAFCAFCIGVKCSDQKLNPLLFLHGIIIDPQRWSSMPQFLLSRFPHKLLTKFQDFSGFKSKFPGKFLIFFMTFKS